MTDDPDDSDGEKGFYEALLEKKEEVRKRQTYPLVINSDQLSWRDNPQARVKFYSNFQKEDAVLPEMMIFRERLFDKSGRHTHQGGVPIFILEGEGKTYIDGETVDWKAGDLVTLPIKPGGVTHQHYNRRDKDNPAEWIAMAYMPFQWWMGGQLTQNETYDDWDDDANPITSDTDGDDISEHFKEFQYSDWVDYESPDEFETLYDHLIDQRNQFRKQMAKAQEAGKWGKIEGDTVDWEWTPQGKIKWYLHPALDDVTVRTLLYSMQEIPPESRSGKQHRQGGAVYYILEGMGCTVVNGERNEWSKKDLVTLPVRTDGVTVQHFNLSSDNPAKFLRVEPAMLHVLGYDMGAGFVQLENCPEYD